jgi:lipoprotein-releasing system permease protein
MTATRWIGFVAGRYVSKGRKNSPTPVFSVLGIATGVLALTVIIAVMNGFQLGFIESILEISSCHVRVEGLKSADAELIDKLRSVPGVLSVLPFEEINVLLRGRSTSPRGALIRGVPPGALALDTGLASKLEMEDGFFDLNDPLSIVLGGELARHLFIDAGDEISLLSITGGIREEESGRVYRVSGIFRSGFYEYDLGWAFINIDTAAELAGEASQIVLGIKLKNRWQDQRTVEKMEEIIALSDIPSQMDISDVSAVSVRSWRDYNRSFFGALRTEKLMMFILVGLIFIVVGLNIFQAQRRIVLERREEIGLLRALGASSTAVRLVFVWDGFIIGLVGAVLGLVPGLLIAYNIQAFFSLLERAVNFCIAIFNSVFGFIGGYSGQGEFAVFSTQVFYLKEIPSRVIPYEVVLIFLFGFFSALLAAWFASGKVSATKPAEVLRYE